MWDDARDLPLYTGWPSNIVGALKTQLRSGVGRQKGFQQLVLVDKQKLASLKRIHLDNKVADIFEHQRHSDLPVLEPCWIVTR